MSQAYCRGCGTALQTLDPVAPGYIPEAVLVGKKQLICQRCFKLTHYGKVGTIQPKTDEIWRAIRKAVNLSKLSILVVDCGDLTGTLNVWKDFLKGKPYLLLVNKVDLLPRQTNSEELLEYLRGYLDEIEMPAPLAIFPVSSLKRVGLERLTRKLGVETLKGDKVALLGATNVGKSSLIKGILALEHSNSTPTISKFPGTTLGLSNWSIMGGRNTIIDTPGLNPGNRLGDLVCAQCGSMFVAERLDRKLWGLKSGKGLILGGLFAVENLSDEERVLLAFAPNGVGFHRTDGVRVKELLESAPAWLNKLCKKCIPQFTWTIEEVVLQPDHDIAVAGLGWISLRGEPAKLRLYLPQGLHWEVRKALIGKKN